MQDGRIYLIAEQNNGLRIRRLRKVDGVWWLFPDNPEYPLERLVILKDTCPCVILADTLSQVAEALLYM